MAERTANVTWSGSLVEGGGTIESVGSGAFGPLDVTWASRAEESDGRTSPEELIAAAHAACFCLALSHGLAQAETPAEPLQASAVVTLGPGPGNPWLVGDRPEGPGRGPGKPREKGAPSRCKSPRGAGRGRPTPAASRSRAR